MFCVEEVIRQNHWAIQSKLPMLSSFFPKQTAHDQDVAVHVHPWSQFKPGRMILSGSTLKLCNLTLPTHAQT